MIGFLRFRIRPITEIGALSGDYPYKTLFVCDAVFEQKLFEVHERYLNLWFFIFTKNSSYGFAATAIQSHPSRSHQLRIARSLKLHCFDNGSRADIVCSRDSVAGQSLQGFLVFSTQLYSLLELFPAVSRYDESPQCGF